MQYAGSDFRHREIADGVVRQGDQYTLSRVEEVTALLSKYTIIHDGV